MRPVAAAAFASVLAIAGLRGDPATARVEEPLHAIVERDGAFELRDYAPHVAAETIVPDGPGDPSNAGFRVLADYIFGANAPGERIAMTAPVTRARPAVRPAERPGERIAMTAPVTKAAAGAGWSVRFIMPAGRTLTDLPRPLDPAVRLVAEPERRFATLRFTGLATAAAVTRRTDELRAAMTARGLSPAGPPTLARYDPPWTLPFARRNEIWIEVARR